MMETADRPRKLILKLDVNETWLYAGTHTVTVAYRTPYHDAGLWITTATGAVLVAILIGGLIADRRRRPSSS